MLVTDEQEAFVVGQRTKDGWRHEPGSGSPTRTEDTTILVLSRAAHLIDAAVQHLQACLEQDPASDTTERVRDILGALQEVQTLAEALPAGDEASRLAQRT